MSELERLLGLQDLDTTLDRLAHRRATLPVREEITAVESELAALHEREVPLSESRHRIERDQKRLEDEVRLVEDRRDRESARLYDGSVTAIKELQAIQEELEGLSRRQSHLEDQIIELMESDEPLRAEEEALGAERARATARREDLERRLAEEEREVDTEADDVATRRAAAAEGIPPDLLDHYETLRAQLGGVGVARLQGTTCSGCHLTLPAVEIDKLRHADPGEIAHCFECGRILVR